MSCDTKKCTSYPNILKWKSWMLKKVGDNTARNDNILVHRYIPEYLIGQFNTSNKSSGKGYFGQYWRPRASGHSKIESRLVSLFIHYTVLVLNIISVVKIQVLHSSCQCANFRLTFICQCL